MCNWCADTLLHSLSDLKTAQINVQCCDVVSETDRQADRYLISIIMRWIYAYTKIRVCTYLLRFIFVQLRLFMWAHILTVSRLCVDIHVGRCERMRACVCACVCVCVCVSSFESMGESWSLLSVEALDILWWRWATITRERKCLIEWKIWYIGLKEKEKMIKMEAERGKRGKED